MPVISDKAVNEIHDQIQTEASERLMAVVEIYGSDTTWTAKIRKPDRSVYDGFGVKPEHKGKSGWEALAKMAENWKRAGFNE